MSRLVFLGSPDVAASTLRALLEAGHEVALVVSAPDRRRGRGGSTSPTPVKAVALEAGIPTTERVADVVDVGAELGVVVAYGRLVRPDVLAALAMVNIHFSLLPRWRGAAPVERAILAGDEVTGVSIMALEEGLDTGPIYARAELSIEPGERADALRNRLGVLGTSLLLALLEGGVAGLPEPEAQLGEATYAAKLTALEHRLDFDRPAIELDRLVRVGRASALFRDKRLLVLASEPVPDSELTAEQRASAPGSLVGDVVVTGSGGLRLGVVQPEGKAPLSFAQWRRGARPQLGERLVTIPAGRA